MDIETLLIQFVGLWILGIPATIGLLWLFNFTRSIADILQRIREVWATRAAGMLAFSLFFSPFFLAATVLLIIHGGWTYSLFIGLCGLLWIISLISLDGYTFGGDTQDMAGSDTTITYSCPHCSHKIPLRKIPKAKNSVFSCSECGGTIVTPT